MSVSHYRKGFGHWTADGGSTFSAMQNHPGGPCRRAPGIRNKVKWDGSCIKNPPDSIQKNHQQLIKIHRF